MNQVLQVAVPAPLPKLYDYRAPAGAAVAVGARVAVEFGRRVLVGVVAETLDAAAVDAPVELKTVRAVLDQAPLFDPVLWDVLRRSARYYHAPLGVVCATALPVGLRRAEAMNLGAEYCYGLSAAGRLLAAERFRGPVQRQVWARLQQGPATRADLETLGARWRSLIEQWTAEGWVDAVALSPFAPPPILAPAPPLSAPQQAAISAVSAALGEFAAFVLDGVTGSGKTEVYLHLLAEVLARGQQGLLLVPEIGLTPQLIARVRERLPGRVAALHSELSEGERVRAFEAAARGEVDVIVGTRSAVWTPLPRLGLVLVDEEHDASYKQQDGIRYHGRDIALLRAQRAAVPVVLGSATPSLESLRNVDLGRYRYLRMADRVGAARPPQWQVVDLRGQRWLDGLAAPALEAIGAHLAQGNQVLVFKNRRGYAPSLLCHDCGWHAECPHCDIALTLHRRESVLRCHQCGHQQAPPVACPSCSSLALTPQGAGTERLEAALARAFPQTPLVRLDRDTTTRKSSFADAVTELLRGEPTIIVGTQMLAKGHHLPAVTLAVIVGVDEGLMSPDFRASERLAQLIVQVAGRAGRAERPGVVLLQTHEPAHPLLQTLLRHGYGAYAREALVARAATALPPVSHAAVLRAEHAEPAPPERFLAALQRELTLAGHPGVELAGPLPAPQPRRQGRWRFQLILTAAERPALHSALARLMESAYALGRDHRLRWHLDVDPLDFG
ncbi:MAG: primosomal protein N' [Lysobacterales bacterium]